MIIIMQSMIDEFTELKDPQILRILQILFTEIFNLAYYGTARVQTILKCSFFHLCVCVCVCALLMLLHYHDHHRHHQNYRQHRQQWQHISYVVTNDNVVVDIVVEENTKVGSSAG
uniref:Uncharacterized protein n=1 Tax=Glossina brevipalpis TaxID=37001 RepID=A0A1A9X4P8_9MUSC